MKLVPVTNQDQDQDQACPLFVSLVSLQTERGPSKVVGGQMVQFE